MSFTVPAEVVAYVVMTIHAEVESLEVVQGRRRPPLTRKLCEGANLAVLSSIYKAEDGD